MKTAHAHGYDDATTTIQEARTTALQDGEDFDAGDLKGFRGDWTEALLSAMDNRGLFAIGFPAPVPWPTFTVEQRAWLREYQRGAIDAVDAAYKEWAGPDEDAAFDAARDAAAERGQGDR